MLLFLSLIPSHRPLSVKSFPASRQGLIRPSHKIATLIPATYRIFKSFLRTPRALRQTLTVDNGKEFSQFKELEAKTGLKAILSGMKVAFTGHVFKNIGAIPSLPNTP